MWNGRKARYARIMTTAADPANSKPNPAIAFGLCAAFIFAIAFRFPLNRITASMNNESMEKIAIGGKFHVLIASMEPMTTDRKKILIPASILFSPKLFMKLKELLGDFIML